MIRIFQWLKTKHAELFDGETFKERQNALNMNFFDMALFSLYIQGKEIKYNLIACSAWFAKR